MMRFTIKYKLFLTLLLVTVVVVGSMVFLIKWRFESGFLDYVNKIELEIHNNLVSHLGKAYKENGSWDFLRENPQLWKKIHRASLPNPDIDDDTEAPRSPAMPGERFEVNTHGAGWAGRHGSRPFRRHGRGRECVLDENKQDVTFCRGRNSELHFREITVAGKTVGYLGVLPRRKLSHRRDLHFSQQQHRFLLLLGLSMVLISMLVALPVSRQLVLPIKSLAAATRKLASGQYRTRVAVDSSDELGELSRDFNTLAMTLENNEQARQQWIADISHELRTPLSVLRGEIEALQDGVRELTPARLDTLHAEVMNLSRLVKDLYELSLSDIGALNYHKQSTDVMAVLDRTLETFRNAFDDKQIAINFEKDGKARTIFADPDRLQQLFSNLLANALRYTDAGGQLRITVADINRSVAITVEDSAPAVAAGDISRLFERLYRVDVSRNRETGGSGLGLAICKNIVEAHEGTITAGNSALGGLKITLVFHRG